MGKKIIFIHGRSIKPPQSDLEELWYEAVIHGLERDFGVAGVAKFRSIQKEFVFWGAGSYRQRQMQFPDTPKPVRVYLKLDNKKEQNHPPCIRWW